MRGIIHVGKLERNGDTYGCSRRLHDLLSFRRMVAKDGQFFLDDAERTLTW
jgi:hypothetical protein